MATEKRRRVFFALWPDAASRAALVDAFGAAIAAAGGRPTEPGNLHVTVAFLGGLDQARLAFARAVPPIGVGPFELVLDRLSLRRRAGILWAAPHETPAALTALERRLWEGLARRGFERESRPYRPHLTLVRHARALTQAMGKVIVPVTALTLVESVQTARGPRYVALEHWPL